MNDGRNSYILLLSLILLKSISAFLVLREVIASIRSKLFPLPVSQIALCISSSVISCERLRSSSASRVPAIIWLMDIFFSHSSRTLSMSWYSRSTFCMIRLSISLNRHSQSSLVYIFEKSFISPIFLMRGMISRARSRRL